MKIIFVNRLKRDLTKLKILKIIWKKQIKKFN